MDPVELHDVSRRYGRVQALTGASLAIPQGTILGLIGPSGSGKTTAVRILAGILKPTAGEAWVLGEHPGRFRARTRERIGYMPQRFVLYPDLTARENLSFIASLFGLTLPGRRVGEVLELLGLAPARDRLTRDLSGGEQRRLALASALVHRPDVLFLDEPTAGIDPLLRIEIWKELRRLADEGRTLLVTTQYVGEAEGCDLVALLSAGRLLALAEPDVLRRHVYGGEILDVRTARPVDPKIVARVPGVKRVRARGARQLIVVAEDAARATPQVVEAIRANAGVVASIEPYEPSFDEVFALLIQNGSGEQEAA